MMAIQLRFSTPCVYVAEDRMESTIATPHHLARAIPDVVVTWFVVARGRSKFVINVVAGAKCMQIVAYTR